MRGEGVGKHLFQFSIFNSRFIRLQLLRILALFARPFARRPSANVATVLYIKPDHLGDLLLATPVLAALRRRFPEAQITAIVGPWAAMVLRHNPDVDVLLTCPFPGFERRPAADDRRPTTDDRRPTTNKRTPLQALRSVVSGRWSVVVPYLILLRYAVLLRAGHHDLAIIGRDDHWWGAALALLAGVPWRVGFAIQECRPFLSDALPWNPRDHVTAQGLALVEATTDHRPPTTDHRRLYDIRGSRIEDRRTTDHGLYATRFDPTQEDMAWVDSWLVSLGIAVGERLVVLHPGTGGPAKLWLPERWAAVADTLAGGAARLLITGGPGEEPLVEAVAAQMRTRPLTLAGQTSVGQLAALLRRAALVLGVDSGPLHLAAAQGVPTLHLYGPGDDRRFGPWGDPARHVVVRAELWCSPCGVFDACPRGLVQPECMEAIGVARVIERAQRLLDNKKRGADRG
jgi:ADP-heptose:LPS heptosyltransferase